METSSSPSSVVIEPFLQALTNRGWCFKDADQIKQLFSDQLSSRGPSSTVDSIESELINMDLRAIGGKNLPDLHRLRQVSYLQGPKVLQISSVRDISRSSTDESSGTSGKRRLLRLILTDGNTELVAIEYSHVTSLSEDLVPGTKIRLVIKAVVRNGIVCLNDKTITVMGGLVQSLFEEWQMNKKYSGFSRPSLQTSDETASCGPPPFEKLRIGASLQRQTKPAQYTTPSLNSPGPPDGVSKRTSSRQISVPHSQDGTVDTRKVSGHPPGRVESSETSQARQKEVVESVPIQNQAAAQKLLQRMNQPNRDNQAFRGRRDRGKWKEEEESAVLTLDEWERKKSTTSTITTRDFPSMSRDEDLAQQLQEQFNLEDSCGQEGFPVTEAENIKISMFDYHRDEANVHGRTGFRGRGGGRGRGRGRGRRGGGRGRG